jgi:hypothetical protein
LARAGWLRDEVTVITERPQFILARAGSPSSTRSKARESSRASPQNKIAGAM